MSIRKLISVCMFRPLSNAVLTPCVWSRKSYFAFCAIKYYTMLKKFLKIVEKVPIAELPRISVSLNIF